MDCLRDELIESALGETAHAIFGEDTSAADRPASCGASRPDVQSAGDH
jgi:hypothetical protein